MTAVVCLHIFFLVMLLLTFCAGEVENDNDYCEKDRDRCDSEGIYKYIGVTNYDDYAIRDKLDDDLELIGIRPKLALKKTEKTLNTYPLRYVSNTFVNANTKLKNSKYQFDIIERPSKVFVVFKKMLSLHLYPLPPNTKGFPHHNPKI